MSKLAFAFILLMGCTIEGGEVTFPGGPGLYKCEAHSPGFENLPAYTFDTETAEPSGRIGYVGGLSSITITTVKGKRVKLTGEAPPGYICEKLPPPVIDKCYEWTIGDSEDPCPKGYEEVIVNTPTSDQNKLGCKVSFCVIVKCRHVVEPPE